MIPSIAILLLMVVPAFPTPVEEDGVEAAEPEYLDKLLAEENYEEFNRLMQIDVPHLSKPRAHDAPGDPHYSEHLEHGDILLAPWQKEAARQAINFERYPTMKWTVVPYTISDKFTSRQIAIIRSGIDKFNTEVGQCIKWVPRRSESSYVFIFNGQGCYSNLGKTGKQQSLSLDSNGCLYQGTILHEMKHAIGFMHEQCRSDRDKYIKVLWDNIKEDWKSQYDITNDRDYSLYGKYDYYSIMHYPQKHPDVSNNLPAFDVLDTTIDANKIGSATTFTPSDKEKILNVYC